MSVVLLRVSTDLLNELFGLGPNRTIVRAIVRDDLARQVVFQIADPDAPDGATELEPEIIRSKDGIEFIPHYR